MRSFKLIGSTDAPSRVSIYSRVRWKCQISSNTTWPLWAVNRVSLIPPRIDEVFARLFHFQFVGIVLQHVLTCGQLGQEGTCLSHSHAACAITSQAAKRVTAFSLAGSPVASGAVRLHNVHVASDAAGRNLPRLQP